MKRCEAREGIASLRKWRGSREANLSGRDWFVIVICICLCHFLCLFFFFKFISSCLFITWGSGFSARVERPRGTYPEQIDAINCKLEPNWNHFCRQNLRHCQFELLDPKHMRLWYKFQTRYDSHSAHVNFNLWSAEERFNKSHFGKWLFSVRVFARPF